MDGEIGDRLIVHGRRIGQQVLEGGITEVLFAGGQHYRIRWTDGHESVMYPGPDVTIVPSGQPRPERRTLTIELRLDEDRDRCRATALMMSVAGTFTGRGHARRHPNDPELPVVGEELAIARALHDLADSLEQGARRTMATMEGDPVHLVP
jgi:hypothetical protein